MVQSPAWVTSILAAVLLFAADLAAEDELATRTQMRKKLEYSTQILAGLVTEDFDKIIKNTRALNQLGEQRWLETDSPSYRAQNQVFWFTTGALLLAAEERNIDAATVSYTQMTVSCINCHKFLGK